jgi:Plasmid pRiA4b ORF-3-like protein
MQTPALSTSVYQLRVVVQGISPLIWRRLLVRRDMPLAALHDVLQIILAWSDVHLHGFRIHSKEYGSTHLGGPSFDTDPRHVPLAALRLHRGECFRYVYNKYRLPPSRHLLVQPVLVVQPTKNRSNRTKE